MKENPELITIIKKLKEYSRNNNAKIWKDIAERLESPNKLHAEVNLSKIERYASDGETIVVPGKVLGSGNLTKKVTVAAWKFSKKAEEKIKKAGGRIIMIDDLLNENPQGSRVRIMR